jgi:hypothetical protein
MFAFDPLELVFSIVYSLSAVYVFLESIIGHWLAWFVLMCIACDMAVLWFWFLYRIHVVLYRLHVVNVVILTALVAELRYQHGFHAARARARADAAAAAALRAAASASASAAGAAVAGAPAA